MSASDKAYEESEDSEMENEQTKPEVALKQKENETRTLGLAAHGGLSAVAQDSHTATLPQGEMFGGSQEDLFSRLAVKPIFNNWQPSDLWAPDDDSQKAMDSNSASFRPPSAGSSVGSAQSSIVSEPIKKNSEDYGKSGSGRLPVFVQEEQDDLFSNSSVPTSVPGTKKTIPAGGVKLFSADINPFPPRHQAGEDAVAVERQFSRPAQHDRWENDDENYPFSKAQKSTVKNISKAVSSSIKSSKKKVVDLFDDDESGDDLFSNSKSTQPNKITENLFDDQEVTKNIRNLSVKSQTPPIKSKNIPTKSKTSPFGDVTKQPVTEVEEDDLFTNKSIFSNTKSRLSHSLFSDDILKFEGDSLFSDSETIKPKSKVEKSEVVYKDDNESLFSDSKTSDKQFTAAKSNVKPNSSKDQSIFGKNLFSDEVDLFADVGYTGEDSLFGSSSLLKKTDSMSKSQLKSNIPSVTKPLSKDIFDDDEDDDLFGSKANSSMTSSKQSVEDDLFSSKASSSAVLAKPSSTHVENDLFGSSKLSVEVKNTNVKVKHNVLKPRGLEKRSLFDSDSEDDLFSSPQGSLNSRKSLQIPSAPSESKDTINTKIQSSSNTEQISFKAPKTDFSSIFSDNLSERNNFKTSRNELTDNKGDIFGEHKDLFYDNPSVTVRTPDLFSNTIVKTVSKEVNKPSKNPLTSMSQSNNNRKEMSEKNNQSVVKPNLVSLSQPVDAKPQASVPAKTDESDDLFSEPEVLKPKKPEPPKSLDIRSITEDMPSNKHPLPEEKKSTHSIQKPSISKKPSPKVFVNDSIPKDSTDGEIVKPPSPSISLPGKLKASQMININPTALLPGARPRLGQEQVASPLESEGSLASHTASSDSMQTAESLSSPQVDSLRTSSTESFLTACSDSSLPTVSSLSPRSESCSTTQEESLPTKSSLLQNVTKERAKIQGKRRPSSRRARQEAIRASSVEVDEGLTLPVPASSTLMSPSTDEEDLFGVPPLDVITDNVKTESPTTDIFGTPTVLSPVTKQGPSSSFVSTPFVHSQPPPLEEEDDLPNRDDDIFASENLLGSVVKDKKPLKVNVQTNKEDNAEDQFRNIEEDSLFSNSRDVPPPLLDDSNDEELFISSTNNKSILADFGDSLFTPSDQFDKSSTNNSLFQNYNSSVKKVPNDSIKEDTDTSPFSSENLPKLAPNDSIFTGDKPNRNKTYDLFSSDTSSPTPVKRDASVPGSAASSTVVNDDSLFPDDNTSKIFLDDSLFSTPLASSKLIPVNSLFPSKTSDKTLSDDPLFSTSDTSKVGSDELFTQSVISSKGGADNSLLSGSSDKSTADDSLFSGSSAKLPEDDSLFLGSSAKLTTDTSLFTASDKSAKAGFNASLGVSKNVAAMDSDESLFHTHTKSTSSNRGPLFHSSDSSAAIISDNAEDDLFSTTNSLMTSSQESEKAKPSRSIKTGKPSSKKDNLFHDDEDDEKFSGNLFSSGASKKMKAVASLKPSLFGDEEDDDSDIFGSSALNKNKDPLKKTTTVGIPSKPPQKSTGAVWKGSKPGSSKPVKMETKQTFSDPLFSNKD